MQGLSDYLSAFRPKEQAYGGLAYQIGGLISSNSDGRRYIGKMKLRIGCMEMDHIGHILCQKHIALLCLPSYCFSLLALGDVPGRAGYIDHISLSVQYGIGDGLDPDARSLSVSYAILSDLLALVGQQSAQRLPQYIIILRPDQIFKGRPADQFRRLISRLLDGRRYVQISEVWIGIVEVDHIGHILSQKLIALFALP